jgi:hypothetical protein
MDVSNYDFAKKGSQWLVATFEAIFTKFTESGQTNQQNTHSRDALSIFTFLLQIHAITGCTRQC